MLKSFDDGTIHNISQSLGDALIGSDITRIFQACDIRDTSGESTKWKRLYYTFREIQQRDRCGSRIGQFIEQALTPARWATREGEFEHLREHLNRALVLSGVEIKPDGNLHAVSAASTLGEAQERANRLRAKLQQRGVHNTVLAFCRQLLLKDNNYFHAVFEATKSLGDRLRSMSGSTADGNTLIDETLEKGKRPFPLIALNRYDSPSLVNEQQGIAHLARGLFYSFRNVTAHEPAVSWTITEDDALDMMSVASLIHRRLDAAMVTAAYQQQTSPIGRP